jgi:quercetin dioxygenase-like cupin family protein
MSENIIHLLGDSIRVLASANETQDALTVVEVTAVPGGGPPMHTHRETEVFFCLEGEVQLTVDGVMRHLAPGQAATAFSGVPHTYRNVSAAPARFVVAITPGGMERFFADLSRATAGGPPDMAVVTNIAGRYGVRFV